VNVGDIVNVASAHDGFLSDYTSITGPDSTPATLGCGKATTEATCPLKPAVDRTRCSKVGNPDSWT